MELTLNQIEEKCKQFIEQNMVANQESANKSIDYMNHSTALYHGQPIYSLYCPKMITPTTDEFLKNVSETMVTIMRKVIREYLDNPEYRKLFQFSKRLEELIVNEPKYMNLLPIARVDIFLNEADLSFKFCEFNTDGSSSMNEDRELNHAFHLTALCEEFKKDYEISSYELFDSWVREFMNIYSTYEYRVEKPKVAIVDFLELGCSIQEFEQFKLSFEKAGYETEICEIRDLTFDGEKLYSKLGMPIDAIYRRAVTSDILEHEEEVESFLEAVRNHKVCLIGNFCTQVVHDKSLFYIINRKESFAFLTEEEIAFVKAHIPYTAELLPEVIKEHRILEDKNRWLIKPKNSYGARGIFAGINFTNEQWETIIQENQGPNYIVQEFVTPYQTYNIDFKKQEPHFLKYSNLTGLYVYNGHFAGVYSRQSNHEIISSQYDENDLATVRLLPRH